MKRSQWMTAVAVFLGFNFNSYAEKMLVCTEVTPTQYEILKREKNKNLFVQKSSAQSSVTHKLEISEPSYSTRYVNMKIEPLYFANSGMGLTAEFRLADHFSLNTFYYGFNGQGKSSYAKAAVEGNFYGLLGSYSFQGTFTDTFYLSAGIGHMELNTSVSNMGLTADANATGTGPLFGAGYSWVWDSGFNISTGALLASNIVPSVGLGFAF